MQKLLLLDGNSMLFRAYYATLYGSSIDGVPSAMSTSNGIPTNAIFGFVMMLNKVIDLIQPDALLVAWDADSQTFRKEEYPAYKGTRKPLDEELIVQFPIVREFLDAAGIRRYEVHGYEADDIIGTMSKLSSEEINELYSSANDMFCKQMNNQNFFNQTLQNSQKSLEALLFNLTGEHYNITLILSQ